MDQGTKKHNPGARGQTCFRGNRTGTLWLGKELGKNRGLGGILRKCRRTHLASFYVEIKLVKGSPRIGVWGGDIPETGWTGGSRLTKDLWQTLSEATGKTGEAGGSVWGRRERRHLGVKVEKMGHHGQENVGRTVGFRPTTAS